MPNSYISTFNDAKILGIEEIVFSCWSQSTAASPENHADFRQDWEKGSINLIVNADRVWEKVKAADLSNL